MTYQEYINKRQEEFNNLPIFYAYNERQWEEGLRKYNCKPEDVVRCGVGFCDKKDVHLLREFYESDILDDLMKDYEFAYNAIYYEMANHEYHINLEGDFDVCSCFGNIKYEDDDLGKYFDQLDWSEATIKAFLDGNK